MQYYFIIALFVAFDQLTKYLVRTEMDLNQSIPVIEGIFHITYIHNYGAAFSILQGQQLFFIVVTFTAVVAVIIYMSRSIGKRDKSFLFSLALIAGGGIGNLVDRIRIGYVVDFFDFRVFPIFNIADIAVTSGCGLLALYLLYMEPKQKVE